MFACLCSVPSQLPPFIYIHPRLFCLSSLSCICSSRLNFTFLPPCSGFCSRKRGPLFLFLLLFSAFFCLHTYFLWCFPLHPPPHSRVFYVPLPLVSSFLFTVLYLCHVSLCTRCYMYLCIELFFSYRNSSCCTCFLISLFFFIPYQ